MISKTIRPKMVYFLVFLASKPKPKIKSFAQATKANITQQASRFSPILSHKDFLYLLQLKKIFFNLSLQLFILGQLR